MLHRLIRTTFGALAAALLAVTTVAANASEDSETYPSRPIKVIVPFGAGGGSDTFVRVIQKAIKDHQLLPQPLVVINRPGAGGTNGSQEATNAPPDGYTILNLHQAILTAKYSGKVDHGPEAFEPIIATGEDAMTLCAADNSRFQSLKDVLTEAKAATNQVTYGANLGAPSHFSALLLEHAHPGAQFRFVQTGGGATRFAELKGGHIELTTFSVSEYLRFKSGGIRALAFLGSERHEALPDTPTAREQGFDVVTSNLQFWWAPKGTPADRIQILGDAFEAAMKTEYVRNKLASMSVAPIVIRGEELRRVIAQRELETAKVGVRKLDSLPNLPAAVGLVVVLLGIAVLIQRPKSRQSSIEAPAENTDDTENAIPIRESLLCAAIVAAYVATLNLRLIPFSVATTLFVFGLGWFLEGLARAPESPSPRSLIPRLAGLALTVALGSHLIFTHVLTIDLP